MDFLTQIHPLLLIMLPVAPLAILAYFAQIYPRWPLVVCFGLPVILSLALSPWRWGLPVAYSVDVAIVLIGLADLWSLPRRSYFQVKRQALRIVSLQKPHRIELELINTSKRTFAIELRDDLPLECTADPAEFRIKIEGRSRMELDYHLYATQRGAKQLEFVYLRIRSRWQWWQRDLKLPCLTVLHVYPDLKQLSEYAILAKTNRLSLLGVRRTRKVGQDNEFERLRDFSRDDVFKHIDWRSTARRQKLTVKDFQSNQSQRIIFMIDCGRMMANEAAGINMLDHALNAMMMLSYVALTQGDSVGLLTFSDEIHTFLPPESGQNQMNRMLHACFDRFPRLVESRYDEAFLYLDSHCRKRSLVILITNLIDEVNANQVCQYLGSATKRHLSLGVFLREESLFQAVQTPPTNDAELYQSAVAADILLWRQQILTRLHTLGVRCLDLHAEELTAPLVNLYLDIKARHLL